MAFWGDYHTHTTYSHGKGSVMDNARAAAARGLKQLAITDHGLSHVALGIRRKQMPALISDCEEASLITGVDVLVGLENNLNTFDGTLDLTADDLDMLDIIQGGYHKAARSPGLQQQFEFQYQNLFFSFFSKSPKKLYAKNTDAYLKLIENYELDFIGHINRDIHADAITVARFAKEKGTFIELNCKNLSLTDEEIEKMAEDGVKFVVNSDAHSPEKVGDMSKIVEVIDRIGVPYELIVNWENIPDFRSSNYKRKMACIAAKST